MEGGGPAKESALSSPTGSRRLPAKQFECAFQVEVAGFEPASAK